MIHEHCEWAVAGECDHCGHRTNPDHLLWCKEGLFCDEECRDEWRREKDKEKEVEAAKPFTIRDLQYAIQHAIDEQGVPDNSEAMAKVENGKVTFYAVIKNVRFKDGTLHTVYHPLH